MRIYLMRHGQAADISIDPEQGLTEDGRMDIERIARDLVKKSIQIQHIYSSKKKRAQQTASIVSNIISPEITPESIDNLKPGDDPANILNSINRWSEDTLVVSHLPFLPALINHLTGRKNIQFSPGTVACICHSGSQWTLEWTIS